MEILEFALEKERLSREYYHQLAEKTDNVGLRNIFEMLVSEEDKHCHLIEQMRNNIPGELTETNVLSNAKEIFNNIKESAEKFDFNISEIELYREARKKERKSRQFYIEKALEVQDAYQQDIFYKLADEEQKHYMVLDNICEFVSEPECYLENAEFVHLAD